MVTVMHVYTSSPSDDNLFSSGEPGDTPDQFRLPHRVWVGKKEPVWVADRENNRIKVFGTQGKFLGQWTHLNRPTSIFIQNEETVYITELSPRVSIFAMGGRLLTRWGNERPDKEPPLFIAPHAIAVDSKGDLYTGEVLMSRDDTNRGARTVQKFT